MATIKTIAAAAAPKAVGPYSQAQKVSGEAETLYVSGQLPIDPATGTMAATIEEQTHQSLKNIGHILTEAGMDYSNVVKTTVLLDDIKDFAAMNAIYAEYFTGDKPARICYEVAKLPMGAKVEIDCIAVK
jgi:2-iminobutanoate/2-iminopropanoate deaminase